MSRPIKFRCWFGDTMWYVIPSILFDADGVSRVNLNHEEGDFSQVPDTWTGDEDYTLMQFTGLFDKNGREVWEGDIVKVTIDQVTGDIETQGIVEIDVNGVMVEFPQFGSAMHILAFEEYGGVEVVGNEHETPELIEVEND